MKLKTYFSPLLLSVVLLCGCGEDSKKTPDAQKPGKELILEGEIITGIPSAADSEEGSFRVIVKNDDPVIQKTAAEVKVDQKNITVRERTDDMNPLTADTKRNTWKKETPLPPDSTAARIPYNKDIKILWGPQWIRQDAGMIRVPDIQLSNDKSLFVFLETTGEKQGPFASRLVLMDAHNWIIMKIIEIPDRKIERFVIIPGTTKIAAICDRQPEQEQPYGIAVINLTDGSEAGFTALQNSPGNFIDADPSEKIYLSMKEGNSVKIYDAADLSKAPSELKVQTVNPLLTVSPDGKKLAVIGNNHAEIFNMAGLRPLTTFDLPAYRAGKAIFPDETQDLILLPDPGDKNTNSLLLRNGIVREFAPDCTGAGTFNPATNDIILGTKLRSRIALYRFPSLELSEEITPGSLPPETKSEARYIFYIPSNESYAVFDQLGNFYLIYKDTPQAKRYRKELLFSNVK